jgi:uncharacterized lipoprotein YehR (DUF1307 family)
MKKILSLICAAAVLILFVAACAVKPDNFIAPAQLYYSVGEYTYHQEDGVIRSETRETKLFNSLGIKTGYIEQEMYNRLDSLCTNIRVTLIKSCNTVQAKQKLL